MFLDQGPNVTITYSHNIDNIRKTKNSAKEYIVIGFGSNPSDFRSVLIDWRNKSLYGIFTETNVVVLPLDNDIKMTIEVE
jgi:hypothetical protein